MDGYTRHPMKQIPMPWLRDFYGYPIPPRLERAEFVAKYLPQYAREYSPPTGIRAYMDKNGKYHVPQSTPGSIGAQLTKRNNRIDAAYALYLAQWQDTWDRDAKASGTPPAA